MGHEWGDVKKKTSGHMCRSSDRQGVFTFGLAKLELGEVNVGSTLTDTSINPSVTPTTPGKLQPLDSPNTLEL